MVDATISCARCTICVSGRSRAPRETILGYQPSRQQEPRACADRRHDLQPTLACPGSATAPPVGSASCSGSSRSSRASSCWHAGAADRLLLVGPVQRPLAPSSRTSCRSMTRARPASSALSSTSTGVAIVRPALTTCPGHDLAPRGGSGSRSPAPGAAKSCSSSSDQHAHRRLPVTSTACPRGRWSSASMAVKVDVQSSRWPRRRRRRRVACRSSGDPGRRHLAAHGRFDASPSYDERSIEIADDGACTGKRHRRGRARRRAV